MDVAVWLRGLGLEQYETLFRENDIDAEILGDLTDSDLEKIGVSLGHRKRLLKAVATLAGPPPAPAAASTPVPPATPPDAAERRQLTVRFSDLVGSTALSARLDPEDMRQVIRAYQDTVSGVVARYDGFTAKFMGDGVLAYFGFPRAHEDDAVRAVHAGLEITDAVAALQTRAREKLAARVGIATGLVVVGDLVGQGSSQEQAVVGDTPNLAARLQGLAEAGGGRGLGLDPTPRRRPLSAARSRQARGEGFDRTRRGIRRARRVGEREPLRGGACGPSRRFRRARGRERPLARAPAPSLGRTGPDRADLGRSGHRQVAAFGLARRAGRGDAAHAAALPMLALSPRQRALSLRAAIRARFGHRAAGAARGQA